MTRDSAFLLKVLYDPDNKYLAELQVMLDNPLNTRDVAWPVDPVYASDRTTIIGCRIPFAAKKQALQTLFTSGPGSGWFGQDYAFRLDVAINLVTAVERVHKHRCVVVDISKTNTLVGAIPKFA